MESTGGKSVSKGEEDHAEAFTAGEGYEVAGFSFSSAVLRFYVFDGGYGSLLRPCRVLLAVQDHLSGF